MLIHGAWHGGWCWRKVTRLLEDRGHRVYAPTLTGVGERAHLLTRDVNLTTHIQDVVALLIYEDLHNVVLAGHSYGGLVISGVARQAADRLSHVAYLDAILPQSGESGIEAGRDLQLKEAAIEHGEGWKIPVPPIRDGELMGIRDSDDLAWAIARLTPHPLATFEETLFLDSSAPYPVPGSYALCTAKGREKSGPAQHAERARELGWPVQEIETGHDLMITEPEATAAFLLRSLSAKRRTR